MSGDGIADSTDLAVIGETVATRLADYESTMMSAVERLVSISSHASNPTGVAAVAALMSERLTGIGLHCETMAPPPLPDEQRWLAPIIFPEMSYDDIGDVVVARRDGADGAGRVLLLGDMDTSYRADASAPVEQFAFELKGNKAFGPGIADMKGGLVTLLGALWVLADTGLASPAVTVVLSPDEQAGSLRSRRVIEQLAPDCSVCFCVECARDGGRLMRTRAACGVGLLEVFGVEAHAGSARAAGVSAVRTLAELIPAIEDLTDAEVGNFVTVGLASGGRRRSVVPGYASCVVDIRASSTAEWRRLDERITRTVQRQSGPPTVRWRSANHRPAIEETESGRRLLRTVERAGAALGISVVTESSAAGGSSAFMGSFGIPTLDGMGASGGDLMTDHEYIEWPTLRERAGLLALSLHLLAVTPSSGMTPSLGRGVRTDDTA